MIGWSCTPRPREKVVRHSRWQSPASSAPVSRSRAMPTRGRRSQPCPRFFAGSSTWSRPAARGGAGLKTGVPSRPRASFRWAIRDSARLRRAEGSGAWRGWDGRPWDEVCLDQCFDTGDPLFDTGDAVGEVADLCGHLRPEATDLSCTSVRKSLTCFWRPRICPLSVVNPTAPAASIAANMANSPASMAIWIRSARASGSRGGRALPGSPSASMPVIAPPCSPCVGV